MLCGAGCVPTEVKQAIETSVQPPPPAVEEAASWQPVGNGIERLEQRFSTSTDARIVLYRFPATGFAWRFDQSGDPKRVGAWMDASSQAVLVINGVYFSEDFKPTGLFVSQSKRAGARQFDNNKSGLIILSPKVALLDTASEKYDVKSLREAAQSYPFLLKDGKAAIDKDTEKYARRSFFGLDRDGRVYVGIVPDEPLSLRELATALLKLDVSWDRVINLDGGPSSGLSFRSDAWHETVDSYAAVPNVIVVEKK